jgi:hypothetical protein
MSRLVWNGLLACLLLSCSGTGESRDPARSDEPAAPAFEEARLRGSELYFGHAGSGEFHYRRDADALKPYLRSLETRSGIEVLRDAPADHEHHHGLMLALGVDDVDFWGEMYAEVPGYQLGLPRAGSARTDTGGLGSGWTIDDVRWLDPRDGSLRLDELRELRFTSARRTEPGDPVLLTWWSRLSVPEGRERVSLWGRPYFGLGLRLAAPFDGRARFVHPQGSEGVTVRGDERLTAGRWCACTAEVAGRTVTVAMYDHPDNPRHPARFFTMAEPFAYLSATLDLAERPLELARDESLDLCWGVAVWEQPVTPERIEDHYRTWSDEVAGQRMASRLPGSEPQGD